MTDCPPLCLKPVRGIRACPGTEKFLFGVVDGVGEPTLGDGVVRTAAINGLKPKV